MKLEISHPRTELIPILLPSSAKITDTKLIIRDRRNIHLIPKNQIKYCSSDSNYTIIYLRSGTKIMTSKCLKHISSYLHSPKFKRIHAKHLINLQFLTKIDITGKKACMEGGGSLPISRAKYKDLITSID